MNVTLKPFDASKLNVLRTWLDQPHLKPWYPDPERDIAIASAPPPGGFQALIDYDGAALGYMRWQYVDRETLDSFGLSNIPTNSVDIDLLIGDSASTAKGIGPVALNLLASQLLADKTVPLLGLTTSVNNVRAHSAFEKAGFHILLQYDPGHGLCHLMVRDLEIERRRFVA